MQVENRGTWVPLAATTCEHGREMGYNLVVGAAVHFDDGSACRRTGLGFGVDEELTGRDKLGKQIQSLLGDAMARLEAAMFPGD